MKHNLNKLVDRYRHAFGDFPTTVTLADPVAAIRRALKTNQPIPTPTDPAGKVEVHTDPSVERWAGEAQPIIATERPWYSPRRAWHTICKLLRGTTQ